MELIRMELDNFRQFEALDGKPQTLHFATAGAQNVTAIYGTNGAGKSTLLNAFTWVLFGETTDALKMPGNLVNEAALARAKPGERVTARVRLVFKAPQGGKQTVHELERRFTVVAGQPNGGDTAPRGETRLDFAVPGEGTRTHTDPAEVEAYIEKLIPRDLFQYFFIDGERIANLAQPKNAEDVRNAVQKFVGLKEILNAELHLLEVENEYLAQAKEHEKANKKYIAISKEIEQLEKEAKDFGDQIKEQEKTVVELNKDLAAVEAKLEANRETAKLQEERVRLEKEISEEEQRIRDKETVLFGVAATQGWLAFALEATNVYVSSNIDLRKKGELPYKYRKPFVGELLARKKCICDRSLDVDECSHADRPGIEAAVNALKAALDSPDLSDCSEQLFGAEQVASHSLDEREQLLAEITSHDNAISDLTARKGLKQEALRAVEDKLRTASAESGANLENERKKLKASIESALEMIGNLKQRLADKMEDLEEKKRERSRFSSTTAKGATAIKRAKLCEDVRAALKGIFGIQEQLVQERLQEQMRSLFRDYSITGYLPEVSAEFRLGLTKLVEGKRHVVADSTGEGQTLALSFITAVAKEAIARRHEFGFPLIIDSQFGALDVNLHQRIGRVLPKHVGQVVLIQTKTQWTPEFRAALDGHIGAAAVLTRRVTQRTLETRVGEDGKSITASEMVEIRDMSAPYVEVADSDSTMVRQLIGGKK